MIRTGTNTELDETEIKRDRRRRNFVLGGLATLVAIGVIGGFGYLINKDRERREESKIERQEANARIKDLFGRTIQKANGGDNYFSLEEQRRFLQDVDYRGFVSQGDIVHLGWEASFGGLYSFYRVGDEKIYLSEQQLRDYLAK